MNKNDFSHGVTSIFRKTIVVLSGLILSLVLLEAGLRLSGFILSSMQESENLRSIKQKGVYRILCLGESTTYKQYPHLLEQVLNQRNIGVRFSVIDKGRPGINTLFILRRVESYLAEYHPDMVVAMMGINDRGIKYYQDISEVDAWIFQHCRIYRFGRILYTHFLKKLQKKDVYGPGRADWKGKPGLDDKRLSIEKAGLPNEVSVDGMVKSDLKSDDKGSFVVRDSSPQGEDLFEPPRITKNTAQYFRLGQLCQKQGKLTQAEDAFKKVVELNPKNDRVYTQLGFLYTAQGEIFLAEDAFKKAIELNPKNDSTYAGLGGSFLKQGKLSQADDSFKKAIELNPKNDQAYAGLGELEQARHGRGCRQAEDSFKKAIEINPENGQAYYELGRLYRTQGDLSRAEDSFRRAFEINPKHERLLGEMFLLYEEMGQHELAKEYSEKARLLLKSGDCAVTASSYRKLKNILDAKGVKLVCVQYPVRNVGPLKEIFENDKNVIFVDNERIFKEALKKSGYKHNEYFIDMFGGDFGHCTPKGNMLLAKNIADVILRKVFNK